MQADYDTPQEVLSVSDDPYDSQVMEPQYDDHSISFDTAESVSEDAFESAETAQFEDEDVSGIATDSAGEEGTDSIDEYSASEKKPIEPVTGGKGSEKASQSSSCRHQCKSNQYKERKRGDEGCSRKRKSNKKQQAKYTLVSRLYYQLVCFRLYCYVDVVRQI